MPNPNEPNSQQTTGTDGGADYKALYEKALEDAKKAQEEADKWKAQSRKNESRAKANAGAANDLEGANEQIADLSQRLAAIEGENAALKASAARAALVTKVAAATGVPETIVSSLAPNDEETLTAAATAIAEAYKTPGGGPTAPEAGAFNRNEGGQNKSNAERFGEIIQNALGR